MARATETEVLEVLEVDTELTEDQITLLLDVANRMVTNVLGTSELDSDTLKDIERYICAHLCAIKEPVIQKEKIGNAETVYQGAIGGKEGLKSTKYGQMALMLDYSGTLMKTGKKVARIRAIDLDLEDN